MNFKPIPVKHFYGKRFNSLVSALDEMSCNEEFVNADIVIIPPEADYVTDEEDIDEDNMKTVEMPQDVPGEVEIFIESYLAPDDGFESEDDIPLSELKKLTAPPIWTKATSSFDEIQRTGNCFGRIQNCASELVGFNEVQVFEKLFDSDVRDLIVNQTILYAGQKNQHNFSFNEEDLRAFIGILLFSGYHSVAREVLYWKQAADTHVPVVANM